MAAVANVDAAVSYALLLSGRVVVLKRRWRVTKSMVLGAKVRLQPVTLNLCGLAHL